MSQGKEDLELEELLYPLALKRDVQPNTQAVDRLRRLYRLTLTCRDNELKLEEEDSARQQGLRYHNWQYPSLDENGQITQVIVTKEVLDGWKRACIGLFSSLTEQTDDPVLSWQAKAVAALANRRAIEAQEARLGNKANI